MNSTPTRRTRIARNAALAAIMGGFIFAASGCLVTSRNHTDVTGTKISSSTLDQVEVGNTTEAWVLATLGDPTEITIVEGAETTKIFRYDYTRKNSSGGTVLVLFAGSSRTTKTQSTYFEVIDGVVSRFWTEYTH